MTTGIEFLKDTLPKPKKGRGPGKRPPLVNTSIRLPQHVVEFFDRNYPYSKQAKMREVLIDFVMQEEKK